MSLFKNKEQETKLYALIEENNSLKSQIKLFETTIEQLKRAFDKQEKIADRTAELENERARLLTSVDDLKSKVGTQESLTSEVETLNATNKELSIEVNDLDSKLKEAVYSRTEFEKQMNQKIKTETNLLKLKLQEIEQVNINLKTENESLSASNKEILDKIGWVRTGREKDDYIGYYGHNQFIKVKKNHLLELPESIENTTVTFSDNITYPLSLMLFLWGSKEAVK